MPGTASDMLFMTNLRIAIRRKGDNLDKFIDGLVAADENDRIVIFERIAEIVIEQNRE